MARQIQRDDKVEFVDFGSGSKRVIQSTLDDVGIPTLSEAVNRRGETIEQIMAEWRKEQAKVRAIFSDKPQPTLPLSQTGHMKPSDRERLLELADELNPIYGSFARRNLAAEDLVRWVEQYRARDR
ncbi:MAG: hypothetical protein ACRENK_15745 [Gemmatimonadaceae bacterium]